MKNKWFTMGAVVAAATITQGFAGEPTQVRLQPTTDGLVVVQEVKGTAEYAYKQNGWKNLTTGKTLKAGATVRSSSSGAVTIRMADTTNFVKVSPSTAIELVSPPAAAGNAMPAETGSARVRSLRGQATVIEHGQSRAAKVNSLVAPGSTVVTNDKTQMDLFFPREGLVVRMKPGTVMNVRTPEQAESSATPKLRLSVDRGGVELNHRTYLAGEKQADEKD